MCRSFLLRWALSFWVKSTVLPNDNKWLQSLKGKKVCYVTYSDACSKQRVLERVCKDLDLPLPSNGIELATTREPAALFSLEKIKTRESLPAPPRLATLIDAVESSDKDILIVPVSIFWGRGRGVKVV